MLVLTVVFIAVFFVFLYKEHLNDIEEKTQMTEIQNCSYGVEPEKYDIIYNQVKSILTDLENGIYPENVSSVIFGANGGALYDHHQIKGLWQLLRKYIGIDSKYSENKIVIELYNQWCDARNNQELRSMSAKHYNPPYEFDFNAKYFDKDGNYLGLKVQ